MAIPKSTFVMGAVTLGLFGFAAYKTMGEKHEPKDRSEYADEEDSYEGDEESEEAYEAYRKEREERDERERAEEEAARKLKLKAVRDLYGTEAATPGTLFAGLPVGAAANTPVDDFIQRREKFQDDTDSTITTGSGIGADTFDRFEIRPGATGDSDDREALCEELASGLRSAWGGGELVTGSADVTVWLNPVQKLRATFANEYRCELAFERYVTPEQWITKDASSVVPLSLIGQSASKVEAVAKMPVEDNGEVSWAGPGLGVGTKPTTFNATLAGGKVTKLTVYTTASVETREALEAQLQKLFGKPATSDESTGSTKTTWSRPKLALDYSDTEEVVLTLGK
ncbi:MAG: hypothetical protein H0T46_10845 [Deltaproteobacteria bacterium]|nr:hypothetical protein [Deltaproteobacteria bacterium]